MRALVLVLVLVLSLCGCAIAHERTAASDAFVVLDGGLDASAVPDASASPDTCADRCALGRSELVIAPPPARRAGFSILLQVPHASTDGTRILATAEVTSARGGIGMSDVLTYDANGAPRAFFTSDVPYVLGDEPGLTESLDIGSYALGRVVGEVGRFANDFFEIVRSDDRDGVSPDAPIDVPLPTPDPAFAMFEAARDGARAVRFDDHRGIVVYATTEHEAHEVDVIPFVQGLNSIAPFPRLSPSGRMAALRVGDDRTILTVVDLDARSTHAFHVDDMGAIAFLDDTRLLLLARGASSLAVLDLALASVTEIDVRLPGADPDHIFDSIDVSTNAETFVTSEHASGSLRVIRCDRALLALRR